MALGAMCNATAWPGTSEWQGPDAGRTPAEAKAVIWLFMVGGASHMESFDPKPELNKAPARPLRRRRTRPCSIRLSSSKTCAKLCPVCTMSTEDFPMQVGYRKRGKSAIAVSDCAERRRLHRRHRSGPLHVNPPTTTTAPSCSTNTGRHNLEGTFPTTAHDSLWPRSLNDNLPQFVVLGTPLADCCAGVNGHGSITSARARRRPPQRRSPQPLAFVPPWGPTSSSRTEERVRSLGRLNRLSASSIPRDSALRARIKAYELAFRMQTAGPKSLRPTARRRRRGNSTDSITRLRRASACCAWPRGGWLNAACASSRSSTQ